LPDSRFDLGARKLPIRPVFLPPTAPQDATPGAFLSWGSTLLHGLTRSPCRSPLGDWRLSWGFPPLQRSRRRESTSGSSRLPFSFRPPQCYPGMSASDSQVAGYGAAHRFSQPLSGSFLSPPSHHFQMGGAPGVRPYRGLILHHSPDGSSPPACLLDVSPADCACSVPRRSICGRTCRCLGHPGKVPFVVFKAFVCDGIGLRRRNGLDFDDRPAPPGLVPPHGLSPACGPGFRLSTVTASRLMVPCEITSPLHSTACHLRE
jgi:hypothetical protein